MTSGLPNASTKDTPSQRHGGHGLGGKNRLRHRLEKGLQGRRIAPEGQFRRKGHACGLAVLEATQPQGTAYPQRPVAPDEHRRYGIGRQHPVLAPQHRVVLHGHPGCRTRPGPEAVGHAGDPGIGAVHPDGLGPGGHGARTGAGLTARRAQGVRWIKDIDGLAEPRWRPDQHPTLVRGKDDGLEAAQPVQREVFYPARGVREQPADELGGAGPRGHLEQPPALVAAGPDGAIGCHRHGQQPGRRGASDGLHHPLAGLS